MLLKHALIRKGYCFTGVVQGVGFRPTVLRTARQLGLSGFVQNRRSDVAVEIQGAEKSVAAFLNQLTAALPEVARLEEITETDLIVKPLDFEFKIRESQKTPFQFSPIPIDLAICGPCREELLDHHNRRYLYPFITCTVCGPRYSITSDTPFDRANTSMSTFTQCRSCTAEYTDPGDRRFHSQTNSCPDCGPQPSLLDPNGTPISGDPLLKTIDNLKAGAVVAIQGIGGFHLAAVPERVNTVKRLRQDKEREEKPFALMAKDISTCESLCTINEIEGQLLQSQRAPILIFAKRAGLPLYYHNISRTDTLGLMLPYTPLHYLLFFHPDITIPYTALIMTSGNLRDEPIITQPQEALVKLVKRADFFLVHNRQILQRTDDSVLRHDRGKKFFFLRRSRGFVPEIFYLKSAVQAPTLALGGDLKNAPALALGNKVFIAPYIGDLENLDTYTDFEKLLSRFIDLYRIKPARLVYDLHPLYHSTRWAKEQRQFKAVGIQHHYAHILSVMAEHGLEQSLGMTFDGTGYGADQTIWGGEFLDASRFGFKRLGHFKCFRLPGAQAAIKYPHRTAYSILKGKAGARGLLSKKDRLLVDAMLDKQINSPLTSSLGRIFDAAGAILDLLAIQKYEAQGPILLEACAVQGNLTEPANLCLILTTEAGFQIDPGPLLLFLLENRDRLCKADLAYLFHWSIAESCLKAAQLMAGKTGIKTISLSGGVFNNKLFRNLLIPLLVNEGFSVFTNDTVPPGDGGISLGQVYFQGP